VSMEPGPRRHRRSASGRIGGRLWGGLLLGCVALALLAAGSMAALNHGPASRSTPTAGASGTAVSSRAPAVGGRWSAQPSARPPGGGTAPTSGSPGTTTAGVLPFNLPSTAVLRSSSHLVFAHYFTPYPLSLDNQPTASDYYTRDYLTPQGEGGIHDSYGGLLRDRPQPVGQQSGDWRLSDLEQEVRTARAAGIDGFTTDILSLSGQNWSQLNLLIQAAAAVDPGFKIMLMPDMSSLHVDQATLASAIAQLAASHSVYRLGDGQLVLSPFEAELHTPGWWSTVLTDLRQRGIRVALVPLFLNFQANARAFAPISYGFSDWGVRSPSEQSGIAAEIRLAHSLGKLWMQPVSVQDERPDQGIYDEADNTENLRDGWNKAISDGADWVQLTTWNDYSEGTQFAPSLHNGYSYLDLSSYYLTRFKTGRWPVIVRDTVYVTGRVQFVHATPGDGQSLLMRPRPGTATPRDDVEVLTFLTAPATVDTVDGGVHGSYSAAAGVQATLLPLHYGYSTAAVVRDGRTTAKVGTVYPVVADPAVQDLQYYAVSSGRIHTG
jgi:Glycosyl hydrolase family 71